MEPFRSITLANGLNLDFIDQGNRYFGDYHRVRVVVRCAVPIASEAFAEGPDDPLFLKAQRLFGDEILFERPLERMGVAGDDVEAVRTGLVESFLKSSRGYLEHPDFAVRFIRSQLNTSDRSGRPYLR